MQYFKRFRLTLITWLLPACLAVLAPFEATAQTAAVTQATYVPNARGGVLRDEIYRVGALRHSGQPVRIVGDFCYSTCTLYLGLPNACVSPRTVFGFHGPSSYGKPLRPAVFERASQLIVAHYPPILQEWYLTVARHETTGLFKVTGAHLISIGAARPCLLNR